MAKEARNVGRWMYDSEAEAGNPVRRRVIHVSQSKFSLSGGISGGEGREMREGGGEGRVTASKSAGSISSRGRGSDDEADAGWS